LCGIGPSNFDNATSYLVKNRLGTCRPGAKQKLYLGHVVCAEFDAGDLRALKDLLNESAADGLIRIVE
jgi:hypothetical protein